MKIAHCTILIEVKEVAQTPGRTLNIQPEYEDEMGVSLKFISCFSELAAALGYCNRAYIFLGGACAPFIAILRSKSSTVDWVHLSQLLLVINVNQNYFYYVSTKTLESDRTNWGMGMGMGDLSRGETDMQ